jgi:hypothetical protein
MFRPTWSSSGDKTMVGGIAASGVFYIGCPRCASVEGLLKVSFLSVNAVTAYGTHQSETRIFLLWKKFLSHCHPADCTTVRCDQCLLPVTGETGYDTHQPEVTDINMPQRKQPKTLNDMSIEAHINIYYNVCDR